MVDKIPQLKADTIPITGMSFASTRLNKTGSWKYMRPVHSDKTPPCNEGCPAGEDIEGWLYLVARNRIEEAFQLLKLENPFPSICGRVCYHPCEKACNRREYDYPIAIHLVERFIGDMGKKYGWKLKSYNIEKREGKIAVIGAGPAGLSCAYHLARMGYDVEVFEKMPSYGGILRYGIPVYRLPKNVIDWEVQFLIELGVKFHFNVEIGKNKQLDELQKDFSAIFIATGAHKSRNMKIEGENLDGVIVGLEFLKDVNTGKNVKLGKKVAVIGGGNTAMDVARTALRLGSQPIILYRRTRNEMPAIEDEIEEALKEGIEIKYLVTPIKIEGKNGEVKILHLQRMKLGEPDSSGRRRPIPIPGDTYTMEVDNVITAIGEITDLNYINGLVKTEGQSVVVNEFCQTTNPAIFAGGDIIDQPRTVTDAIGSGKRAAIAIDSYLQNKTVDKELLTIGYKGNLSMARYLGIDKRELQRKVVLFNNLNMDHFIHEDRHPQKTLDLNTAIKSFDEVNLGYDENIAIEEAGRCFNCGVCNHCDNCIVFCPDVAVYKENNKYYVDYDYCKGCGLCAFECPRYAIDMIKEGR